MTDRQTYPSLKYDYISTPRLDHCLRYAVQFRLGREPCTAKDFPPGLGVVPGSFFNAVHRTTLLRGLASPGILNWFFKVGIVSLALQIGLQIGAPNWFFKVGIVSLQIGLQITAQSSTLLLESN
jgi:hypothetical protein